MKTNKTPSFQRVKQNRAADGPRTTRRDLLYAAAAGALAGALPAGLPQAQAKSTAGKKPNILMVYVDQHRPDAIGAAGNPYITTPTLDRLAREGTRFSHMWSQSPVCRPARASFITGRYPHETGIVANRSPDVSPAWPTIMKSLQAAGYETATFGKTHYFFPDVRTLEDPRRAIDFDVRSKDDYIRSIGFDHVLEETGAYEDAVTGYRSEYTDYLEKAGLLDTFQQEVWATWRKTDFHFTPIVSKLPQEADITSFVAGRTIEWIEKRDSSKPFFITYAPIKPHLPFIADAIWAAHYADKPMPGGPRDEARMPNAVWKAFVGGRYDNLHNEIFRDEQKLTQAKRAYYAMISLVDQKVGEIMQALEKRGELDNTWIIYTSDHGEMLGDHLLMEKNVFYLPAVGVPGLVRPPMGAPKRQLIDAPTEVIDLSATIIDIADATPPAGMEGTSLLPAMNGEPSAERHAFSEIGTDNNLLMAAVTDGEFRYTVEATSKTPCELFDLKNDPQELTNLVDDPRHAARVRDMQERLIEPHLRKA